VHFPLIVDALARLELLREPNHHQRKSDQKEEETWARTVVSLVPHFLLALSEREKISWKAKKRVIVPAVCAELSRNGLNSDSLQPLFGQRAGMPYGCGMGRPYGGNYGQAPE
jgi:hypothetical protein